MAADDGAAAGAGLHMDPEHDALRAVVVEVARLSDTSSILRRMAFPPVESSVDFVALEERVLERWRQHDVFAESLRRREGAPEWVFYEGPPTANGRPGLHHVWARSFKDLFPRFHTMRGRYVARKGGWDCHGLPVEVEVEKELGLSGKTQIRDFGIEEFNRRCRESVQRYVEEWAALTERMGMWLDTDGAYWTLTNGYIETVWWLVRQMWDKGLLYEGFKVVPYCGRCGTALSSHEVAQGYQDITEDSVYVRFPVVDRARGSGVSPDDCDLLVWTTTPWTLISNVAAAVGPEVEYVRVRRPGVDRDVVLGRDRVEAVLGPAEEVGLGDRRSLRAADLAGLHYERPFDFVPIDEPDANRVVVADFVTTEDGSGIVHLAPAFGEVDREVGEAEGLPTLNPVDAAGRFEAGGRAVGRAVREGGRPRHHRRPAGRRPAGEGRGLHALVPPLLAVRDAAHLLRQDLLVRPDAGREGRPPGAERGDQLASRAHQGRPLRRLAGEQHRLGPVAGPLLGHPAAGVALLRRRHRTTPASGRWPSSAELAGRDLSDLDLHRPYVDEVTFPCPVDSCGATATRLEPVLDAWFDSGSMPAAQFHHPFDERGRLRAALPGRLHLRGDRPDEGLVLLPPGREHAGLRPDAVPQRRLPGPRRRPGRGQDVEVQGQRHRPLGDLPHQGRRPAAVVLLLGRLAVDEPPRLRRGHRRVDPQVPPHAVEHAVVLRDLRQPRGLHPGEDARTPPKEHVLDRWLRSRREGTVAAVTDALEGYDTLAAAQTLESFVDDLSNWYVRRSRPRFWKASDPGAFAALYESLSTVALLLAPFTPVRGRRDLQRPQRIGQREVSVHLEDWPVADGHLIDAGLEAEMALARRLVALGRAARGEARMKVRQPLRRALLLVPGRRPALAPRWPRQVSEELNVKSLEVVESLAGLIRYSVVPNFRALGPRLGPKLPAVKAALASADGAEVSRSLEETGGYTARRSTGSRSSSAPTTSRSGPKSTRSSPWPRTAPSPWPSTSRSTTTCGSKAWPGSWPGRSTTTARPAAWPSPTGSACASGPTGPVAEAAERHGDWIAGEVLAVDWQVNPAETPSGATLDVEGHRSRRLRWPRRRRQARPSAGFQGPFDPGEDAGPVLVALLVGPGPGGARPG